jgi:SPP1 family holin
MDKGTFIRTIVLAIALINQVAGTSVIALDEGQVVTMVDGIYLLVSTVVTGVASLWAWWKNNYVSKKGQAQAEVLERNGLK